MNSVVDILDSETFNLHNSRDSQNFIFGFTGGTSPYFLMLNYELNGISCLAIVGDDATTTELIILMHKNHAFNKLGCLNLNINVAQGGKAGTESTLCLPKVYRTPGVKDIFILVSEQA